jgi:hypothetical protein
MTMKNEYLDFIIFLENTLASFYANLKNDTTYERIKTLLEFMETHSFEHAKIIKETKVDLKEPELNENLILDHHNNLTKKVLSKITAEKNLPLILQELAATEESIGNLYKKISSRLNELSEYYKKIAGVIGKIGDDEYDHRDLLLRDRDRLSKK